MGTIIFTVWYGDCINRTPVKIKPVPLSESRPRRSMSRHVKIINNGVHLTWYSTGGSIRDYTSPAVMTS